MYRVIQGRLVLTNTVDGTEQVYRMLGTGQKPLPLDHILIECPAKERYGQCAGLVDIFFSRVWPEACFIVLGYEL